MGRLPLGKLLLCLVPDRRAQRADVPLRGDAVPHREGLGPPADRRRAVPAEPRAGPRRRRDRPRVDRPGARRLRRQPRHLHGRLPGQAPQQGPARRAGAGLDAGRPGGPADPERPHPAAARPPQGHRAARRLRLPHRHPRALRERRPRRRPHHRAHRRLPRAGLVAGGRRAGGAAGVPHLHVGLQRLLGDPSGPGRAAEPAPVGGLRGLQGLGRRDRRRAAPRPGDRGDQRRVADRRTRRRPRRHPQRARGVPLARGRRLRRRSSPSSSRSPTGWSSSATPRSCPASPACACRRAT